MELAGVAVTPVPPRGTEAVALFCGPLDDDIMEVFFEEKKKNIKMVLGGPVFFFLRPRFDF